MKKLSIIITILVFTNFSFSQKIINATSQGWAGGVCCTRGVNYTITFELDNCPKNISIATIYLQGSTEKINLLSPLMANEKNNQFSITFGTRTDYSGRELIEKDVQNHLTPPVFEGVALLILMINDKKNELVVDKFEELMYLAYP